MAIKRRLNQPNNQGEKEDPLAGYSPSIDLQQIRQKNFFHPGDVTVSEDVKVSEVMVVGGNLQVNGNLKVSRLYCYGRLEVRGSLEVSECYIGDSLKVEKDVRAISISVGFDTDQMETCHVRETIKDGHKVREEQFVFPQIAERITDDRESLTYGDQSIVTSGNLTVKYLKVDRGVEVGGCFTAHVADIVQSSTVGSLSSSESILITAPLNCNGDICCEDLSCVSLTCFGNVNVTNLEAFDGDIMVLGSIFVEEELSAEGSIQVGHSITGNWVCASAFVKVGGFIEVGTIEAGEDYGVFAGLCIPRSKWETEGYVSSLVAPKNLLSGVFR